MQLSSANFHPLIKQWYQFWEVPKAYPDKHWGFFLLRITILLGLYVIMDRLLMHVSHLPESSYQGVFIYLGFLERLFTTKYAFLLVPMGIASMLFGQRLIIPWTTFERGKSIRFIVVLAAGLLAWVYATYDYNLYFNQGHAFDRLLLLALVVLIYWRPIFVFPFLTVLLSIIWQFDALPGFSWGIPRLPINMILLFGAFFIFYVLTKTAHIADFVLLMGSVIAGHYWIPGTGKLNEWWLLNDQIRLLIPNTFANGWLAFLDPETISKITETLAWFNWPMRVFTIIVECGMIFFFWRRKLGVALLVGCMLMNLAAFGISGICFWMWVILDAGFLLLLLRKDAFANLSVFQKPHLIASVILIAGSAYWFQPVKLAWLDVPLTYTYRWEAYTIDGKTYTLPPRFFAPFDWQFTLGAFEYLNDRPQFPIGWGATNAQETVLASWFQEPHSLEQVFDYEKTQGNIYYDADKIAELDAFLLQTILHWNERLTKDLWLTSIQAPRYYWTFPESAGFNPPKPIERLVAVQVTSYFNQGQYAEIRSIPVHEVKMP